MEKPKKVFNVERGLFDKFGAPGDVSELLTDWGTCRRCELCEGRRSVVLGDGSWTAKVMVVGQWPGIGEDKEGRPFVAREGLNIKRWIHGAVPENDIFWTNVLACRVKEKAGYGAQLRREYMEECRPRLEGTVSIVNPDIIVALGTHAKNAFLSTSASLSVLREVRHKYKGKMVLVCINPAALSRQRQAGADKRTLAALEEMVISDMQFLSDAYQEIKGRDNNEES